MIDFRVLGTLDLRGPDGEEILSVLAQPKRTALLTYLALAEPGAFQRRDKLVGVFWPDLDQERARGALRKSIHFLRRSLGDELIVNRGDESVGLDCDQIWVDAGAFEAALEAEDPEGALELYRGDFLEGFFLEGCQEFESWVAAERERLRILASGVSWTLAHQLLQEGKINDGEQAAQRALALAPTDESEARRFIVALAEGGDRAAAIQFFEAFARGIRAELELEPSEETLAAVEAIRGGGEAPPGPMEPAEPAPSPSEPVSQPDSAPSDESTSSSDSLAAAAPPPAPDDPLSFLRRELAPELEVMRHIGSGSVGEVYLARQQALDRLVAVKVLARSVADDPVARTRFEREAKAAAALDHPNAVSVHRFGVLSDGVPYLVMQYVKGGTLAERLAAEGPLPVEQARKILTEVAAALAAAHKEGFIHRDVRPANVLYDPGTDRAILSDFGLAGILPEKEGVLPRVTQTGEIIGSADYLSPEQLKGEEPTEGTDVYALGVLGYEILTGDSPFSGKTERQRAQAHLHGTPRLLTALREDVDRDLADLLERCLAKDPKKRPRAEYLVQALEKAPGAGDLDARLGDKGERGILLPFMDRPVPGIVAAAILLLAVIGLVWVGVRLMALIA